MVDDNEKKRFEVARFDGVCFIRAAQGHSIKTVVVEEVMTPITVASGNIPQLCVHDTHFRSMNDIFKFGLCTGGER